MIFKAELCFTMNMSLEAKKLMAVEMSFKMGLATTNYLRKSAQRL